MDRVLSARWRMLSQSPNFEPPPRGMDRLWLQAAGWAGRLSGRTAQFLRQADRIKSRAKNYRGVSDGKLRDLAATMHVRYLLDRDTEDERDQAFAMLCEVAARALGLRPYREQVAGALALNAGCIAEMATGEGKTLVAAMSAVLAGWRGKGCHIITANDYLARRDAGLMAGFYRFCGLSVASITLGMNPDERRRAYNADVTYCTSKEAAGDFLRDRLLQGGARGLPGLLLSKIACGRQDLIGGMVQRGLSHAIVDEADSVLIDEACTPLLISGPACNQEQVDAYGQAARLAAGLDPSTDYRVVRHPPAVSLTAVGKRHLRELAEPLKGLWAGSRRREELVTQALIAIAVYMRDQHYVLDDDKVVIVDEFTGRLMPDRTWRDGLHQAIEAKEGVPINLPSETYARISFQRFFLLYKRLSGMSGTVAEAQEELWGIYRMPVVSIPTHRPCRRTVISDRLFTTAAAKWRAVMAEIGAVHRSGRPILIGTGSIHESVQISRRLTDMGLDHCLLNAVQEASEARIIADAGQKGRITVATNMAGRGTDIKLGPGVAQLGGLHVLATQRFSARRIDRQLAGRCARQGDPGSAQAFISLEDDLIQRDPRVCVFVLRRWHVHHDRECASVFWRWIAAAVQRRAERCSLRLRREVLSADDWLDQNLGFADSGL